ncbi:NAD dependent epimerase/dehydratase [Colletotrichum falcatum]|nr:NAD dependent epimerase/dehydratase [Colletotrichum falcatum]
MASKLNYVLVTGATGFIGAHVVDVLLSRGVKVRGATRSLAKGRAMIEARPQSADRLDFVQIQDFENTGVFAEAVKDVDAVIHVASPFTYDTKDNEKELIIPAVNGVRSILEAAAASPRISRVVITSSFAAVLDADRKAPPYFTYTGRDWNPLTYAEAAAPETSAVVAYRGSKKFAELAAWDFVKDRKPRFDVVTLCPPMTFGPVVHPVGGAGELNESNAVLWRIASGEAPLPVARVPFWIDVRDLAVAHVEALLRPEAGGRRYVLTANDRFSYGLAAEIIAENFDWARGKVAREEHTIDESHGLDGETAAKELGLEYRKFSETVVDLVKQVKHLQSSKTQ